MYVCQHRMPVSELPLELLTNWLIFACIQRQSFPAVANSMETRLTLLSYGTRTSWDPQYQIGCIFVSDVLKRSDAHCLNLLALRN